MQQWGVQPVDFLPLQRKQAVTPTPNCFLSSESDLRPFGSHCFHLVKTRLFAHRKQIVTPMPNCFLSLDLFSAKGLQLFSSTQNKKTVCDTNTKLCFITLICPMLVGIHFIHCTWCMVQCLQICPNITLRPCCSNKIDIVTNSKLFPSNFSGLHFCVLYP